MNVPAFIDTTVEEQAAELRSYFKSLGAEISEENSKEGLYKDLHQIIEACDLCFKEASEKDVESVLNSIVSLLVMIPVERSENLILSFCEKLSKVPTNRLGLTSLRVLSNLFHGWSVRSPLRFVIYYNLVRLAGQADNIQAVFSSIEKMKLWLADCGATPDQYQRLLRVLHESLTECKQSELASKVMIELLGTYTEENASHARDDAHRCIVTSLGDPGTFLMDHLLTLKPVKFLEGEAIHDLLTIFVSDKLSGYLKFYKEKKDFVDSLGLSHEQNMQKMRLLTFMQMAENKKEISFDTIQEELQLEPDSVEGFVIEVIRTKLVRARMDQFNRKVLISSTMHRTFGKPQWVQLREVLYAWRGNLQQVDDSMNTVLTAHLEQVPQ